MSENDNPVIWNPSKDDLTRSPLARFRDHANEKYRLSLRSYDELHGWSVNPKTAGAFWIELFLFLDLKATTLPTQTFETAQRTMYPSPKFFPGTRMNFAGSILQHRDPSAIALIEAKEGCLETTPVTWAEIYRQVETLAGAMRAHEVQKGDRVVAIVTTNRLAVALCLATLSIGAIWSSISPDHGPKGILDRVLQTDPKLIFTDTSVAYNGKARDLSQNILGWTQAASKGRSLKNIVLNSVSTTLQCEVPKAVTLERFSSKAEARPLQFEQVPFSHPGFIFYSSGTTGAPKCILHSAGGAMLQIKKDYILQIGLVPTDVLFQYTTTAWIMWAFLVTCLSTGAAVVVYDGSPLYPNARFLPQLLSKLRVTVFGTSAKFLTDLKDSNIRPREEFDLSALRKVTSTGSVLPGDVAKWFYETGFPTDVQLISGSGGTDCACSWNPLTSVHADEITGKSLGMAVDVFDPLASEGKSIEDGDTPGELVCMQPFPSQPLTFWGPGGDKKYHDAYFSTFPNVWVQGDLIRINTKTKGIQMLGRSDGVLNLSGVRFGSAEIYNVVRLFPSVEDSVCTGQRRPQDRDETVVLFLKMKQGEPRTEILKEQVRNAIGRNLSKRHMPKYVFYVNDIPYSNVGKKLEILVKNIISGRKAESTVVANPESLALYERYFHIEQAAKSDTGLASAKIQRLRQW